MFVLNLAHFFTRLYGEGSRAANSKLTFIWTPSSRSYIVFALVGKGGSILLTVVSKIQNQSIHVGVATVLVSKAILSM